MRRSLWKLLALCEEEPSLWVWLAIDTAFTWTLIAVIVAL